MPGSAPLPSVALTEPPRHPSKVVRLRALRRDPSLSDRVASNLTEAILSDQIPRGTRLPSERELCLQLRVSRTVVREAVRSLLARGLLAPSGRGVEVVGAQVEAVTDSLRLFIRGQQAFSYDKIHEVRSAIEVETAGLAAQRALPEDLKRLESLCAELDERLAVRDFAMASALDFEFHRALASASGNELFLIMLDSIGDILREVRERAYPQPGVGQTGLKDHLAILRCVARRDKEATRVAMVNHLARAEATWRQKRIAASSKGKRRKGA